MGLHFFSFLGACEEKREEMKKVCNKQFSTRREVKGYHSRKIGVVHDGEIPLSHNI
jgi:hypothetical protein